MISAKLPVKVQSDRKRGYGFSKALTELNAEFSRIEKTLPTVQVTASGKQQPPNTQEQNAQLSSVLKNAADAAFEAYLITSTIEYPGKFINLATKALRCMDYYPAQEKAITYVVEQGISAALVLSDTEVKTRTGRQFIEASEFQKKTAMLFEALDTFVKGECRVASLKTKMWHMLTGAMDKALSNSFHSIFKDVEK